MLLVAFQGQPLGAFTLTLPVPPVTVNGLLVGEMEYLHDTASWFTVKVLPAMVIVPDLELLRLFAATEYFTVPLPLPLLPDVTVIQLLLLAAVQEQPAVAVTLTLPVPPLASKDLLAGEME